MLKTIVLTSGCLEVTSINIFRTSIEYEFESNCVDKLHSQFV
jgi:hypothetical protein